MHLFEPVGNVFVVYAAYVDGPLVCVVRVEAGGAVGRVEGFGDGAVDLVAVLVEVGKGLSKGHTEWSVDLDALHAVLVNFGGGHGCSRFLAS